MTAPPDATAIFRTVLANPADEAPRLVFADWLEDTAVPANIAWAQYLRAHTSLFRDEEQARWLEISNAVRARLTLHASVFAAHHEHIPKLIPLRNISLSLKNFTPTSELAELVPQSVADTYCVIPIAVMRFIGLVPGENLGITRRMTEQRRFFFAQGLSREARQTLKLIMNGDVIVISTSETDVRNCIIRTYGNMSGEAFDSPLVAFFTAAFGQ